MALHKTCSLPLSGMSHHWPNRQVEALQEQRSPPESEHACLWLVLMLQVNVQLGDSDFQLSPTPTSDNNCSSSITDLLPAGQNVTTATALFLNASSAAHDLVPNPNTTGFTFLVPTDSAFSDATGQGFSPVKITGHIGEQSRHLHIVQIPLPDAPLTLRRVAF